MLTLRLYRKYTLYLIAITALLKILIAPMIELGNDEVYYYTYALKPAWNYFDHPPMVGWMIRFTSFNLLWISELSLRLGSILSAALSTWFVFKTGKLLANERVGWYSALLYTASIYTGFIAGFFILPDSPQMPFWTGALYIMAHLMLRKSDENDWGIWLLLGLVIGLAALCKVHGLFLWVGFGFFILLKRREWLGNTRLYVSALITIICILPIIYWNWQNNFITYRFHAERVTNTGIQWEYFFKEIAGEIVYQNPIVFILLLIAIIAFIIKRIRFRQNRISIWLFSMSLPMLFTFWGIALFNPTLPHWSGPAFIPLFFLCALWLDQNRARLIPHTIKAALALLVIILATGILLIRLSPVNFGSKSQENYGEYCPTLDVSGWTALGVYFKNIADKDRASGIMKPGALLLTNKWFPGGHLEFYVSRPTGMPLIGVGLLQNLHQFAWLNKERPALQLGSDAYAIVPSNLPLNITDEYGIYFTTIEAPIKIQQIRGGGVVRYFYIYRLKNCKKVPAAIL